MTLLGKERQTTMNIAKCPKCEAVISVVETEHVVIGVRPTEQWHGISYLCPSCKTLLSVQIDPVAMRNQTAEQTVSMLKPLP